MPEEMYDIAMRFAEQAFGGEYEAVVAVHTDKNHLHAHIVINSVNMEYFAGMKLFNRVIDGLGINMEQQRRYEVFDRIYEKGMREKEFERDRNSR